MESTGRFEKYFLKALRENNTSGAGGAFGDGPSTADLYVPSEQGSGIKKSNTPGDSRIARPLGAGKVQTRKKAVGGKKRRNKKEKGVKQRIGHAVGNSPYSFERCGNGLALDLDSDIYLEFTENGFWKDSKGIPISVSASDLERHAYCPLSWKLSKDGIDGKGEAITAGIDKHQKIHEKIESFHNRSIDSRREIAVWMWTLSIVIIFLIDSFAFIFL